MKITFRNFSFFKDFFVFSKMMQTEWPLGKYITGRKTLGGILYALDIISDSNVIITALDENNKQIGFAGLDIYKKPKGFRAKFAGFLMHLIIIIQPKKIRNHYKKFYSAIPYRPKEMREKFDSELSILILNPAMRGKNIGRKLFEYICGIAKRAGCKSIVIDTDDLCGYEFYESIGCKRIFAAPAPRNAGWMCSEIYSYSYWF